MSPHDTLWLTYKPAKVALRKDLRDLNQDELYLYVEGLKKFQSQDKSDWLSYFQIAGQWVSQWSIHLC